MSQGKKELYSVDILHSISKHPIAGVTNSFKGTAGLLKGSSTFAPRVEKKCPGQSGRKVRLQNGRVKLFPITEFIYYYLFGPYVRVKVSYFITH